MVFKLSAFSTQLSAISYPHSAFGDQPSALSFRHLTFSGSLAADGKSLTTIRWPSSADSW